jgi:hypothetical protein
MSLAKSCHYASPAISETEAPFGAMKAKNLPSLVLSTDSFSGNDDEFGNNSVAESLSRPGNISAAWFIPLSRARVS